jgi:hypothetical protein
VAPGWVSRNVIGDRPAKRAVPVGQIGTVQIGPAHGASVGGAPPSLTLRMSGRASDVPGWVDTVILAAWAVAGMALLAAVRVTLVDRRGRRVLPWRRRAGLTSYRLARLLYRAGPLALPVRAAYRAVARSTARLGLPAGEGKVTMWSHGHTEGGLRDS